MGNKLIENVDDEIWRKFTGYCKIKGQPVNIILVDILKDFLKKEGIK